MNNEERILENRKIYSIREFLNDSSFLRSGGVKSAFVYGVLSDGRLDYGVDIPRKGNESIKKGRPKRLEDSDEVQVYLDEISNSEDVSCVLGMAFRFPENEYSNLIGLCGQKVVAEVSIQDYSLQNVCSFNNWLGSRR